MTDQVTPPRSTPQQLLPLLLISLILGIIFDQFFYMRLPGVSWWLFIDAVLLGLLCLSRVWQRPIRLQSLWLILPILAVAAMVGVRASHELAFLNIVVSTFLLLLLALQTTGKKIEHFLLLDYFKTILVPFAFIPKFFEVLIDIFSVRWLKGNGKAGAYLKGLLMALPALVIFAALFSSADLVFKKYVLDLFQINISPDTLFQTVLVLVVGAVMLGAYGYILKTRAADRPTSAETQRKIGQTEIHVMLGLINALFLVFIAVQIRYLFGGQSVIAAQGFTFAEYARRGFFELIAAAIIAFLIVWAAEQSIARNNHRLPTGFTWLSGLLNVLLLTILISAFQRLNLYEQAYGFTTSRWYAHVLIIWLGVLVLMFIVKIIRHQAEAAFLRQALALIVLFLLAVNVINPDRFVAEQNWQRYEDTGKLDPFYLTTLSVDAVPTTIKALDTANPIVRGVVAKRLYQHYANLQTASHRLWPSFNMSRSQALKLLKARSDTLAQYKNYQTPPTADFRTLVPTQ